MPKVPRGSRYPNANVLGPNYYTCDGSSDLRSSYLGTGTPRVHLIFRRVWFAVVRLEGLIKRGLRVVTSQKGMSYPRGSKYPIFEVSGSKNHTLDGVWTRVLKYWVLGPSGYHQQQGW